jgi:hypothetical protein
VTTPALTIAQILDQPAVVPLWPIVGQALGLSESSTYRLAADDQLPIEVIRLGRRRVARLIDLHRFLGLLPEGNAAAPEVQSGTPAAENSDAPGVQPGASSEKPTPTSANK